MSAEIFISFASQDYRVAMTLCSALESRGINCWISARDILPGENFQVSIVRAIRQAKVMLLVFTANSNNSDEMGKELALASQSKLIVVPLRIEDVTPNEAFAYEFATRQWIDFFADWELAVEQLAQRIQSATRGSPDHVAARIVEAAPVETPFEEIAPSAAAQSRGLAGNLDDDDIQGEPVVTTRRPRRAMLYVAACVVIAAAIGVGLAMRGLSASKAAPSEARTMMVIAPGPVAASPTSPDSAVGASADASVEPAKPVRKKKAAVAKPTEPDVPF